MVEASYQVLIKIKLLLLQNQELTKVSQQAKDVQINILKGNINKDSS